MTTSLGPQGAGGLRIRALLSTLLGAALLLLLLPARTLAAQHALLIGVSQYPHLAPHLQLRGPANDVRLMQQVLLQRGFDRRLMQTLADGVEGATLPTRAAIVEALAQLASRVRPGDQVYLHFSGHGTRQIRPATGAPGSPRAPEWQAVFLPRDVRQWDGKSGADVAGALTDEDLREMIDRIGEAGAFVWAVFDACNSAALVRGAAAPGAPGAPQLRQIDPAELGFPAAPAGLVTPAWARPTAAAPQRGVESGPARKARAPAVYFYAAQSTESASSLPLAGSDGAVVHGVFSATLAQALATGLAMSHRQLGQHVLARYDRLEVAQTNPLFGGDGLDMPVFGQQAASPRQWPVTAQEGRLLMPAGALMGLAEGALFAILADPLAPAAAFPQSVPAGTLGVTRLASVAAHQGLLQPVPWQGFAALPAAALPKGAWVRLLSSPPSFTVRVAVDDTQCPSGCLASRAASQLQRAGVPGVDVRWVPVPDAPDLTLRLTAKGARLVFPDEPAGSVPLGVEMPATGPGKALHSAEDVDLAAQNLARALHKVARARNLLRLAAAASLSPRPLPLVLRLTHMPKDSASARPLDGDRVAGLRAGDQLTLHIQNTSVGPVDLAVVLLDGQRGVQVLYPQAGGATPRLAPEAAIRPLRLNIDASTTGLERLLVLATPMRRGQEAADFRFLEQTPLERARGVPDEALQALLDACFADHLTRSNAAASPLADGLSIRAYTFLVER